MPLVSARKHVCAMRGGSNPQLFRCSDGRLYVVKFQNNPQHDHLLANELMATRLAQHIGLPVAETAIVQVGPEISRPFPTANCGFHYGSRYALDPRRGYVFDYLPQVTLRGVKNLSAFAGMLALDQWVCNADWRQAVFCRAATDSYYTVTFIDHGHCFNAGSWDISNGRAWRATYPQRVVYGEVRGWDSFEPWLSRIEHIDSQAIWESAREMPPEWYRGAESRLCSLVEALNARRRRVASLLAALRNHEPQLFRLWNLPAMVLPLTARGMRRPPKGVSLRSTEPSPVPGPDGKRHPMRIVRPALCARCDAGAVRQHRRNPSRASG